MKLSKIFIRPALWAVTLVALTSGGCSITTEGIKQFEVQIDEIFPPSKAVASYVQTGKPKKLSSSEAAPAFGANSNAKAELKSWNMLNGMSAEYGIPGRKPKAAIVVCEMSDKKSAYGIYTHLRKTGLPDENYVKIGVHGTLDGERLIFAQDQFLILVRDLGESTPTARRALLINFGRNIADRIPRDITDIPLVGWLPYENRVPASERLEREALQVAIPGFKRPGISAKYKIENRECTVFIVDTGDDGTPKGVIKDAIKAMRLEGEPAELAIGDEGFKGKFKGLATMVARRDKTVYGCSGTMTEQELMNVMAGIDRRVKPYVAPKFKVKEEDESKEEKKSKKGFGQI